MDYIFQTAKTYPRTIVVVLMAIFLVLSFNEAVSELLTRVTSEERYSHAPLVFVMAIYLIWIKRKELDNYNNGAWIGLALVVVASLLLVVGELSAIWTIVQYALLVLMLGIVWTMVGFQIKRILIPFMHLFLVIPLPYMLDVMLSGKMQLVSSNLGVDIVRLIGISIYQEGNVIDLGMYKLQVVEACSGLNYMYPLMTISLMMAYMYIGPFYARAILFLSSIPISIIMNSIRIAVIAVLVTHYGEGAAQGFTHYFEGWVVFVICIALVLLEAKIFNHILKYNRPLRDSFDYLETTEGNDPKPVGATFNKTPVILTIVLVVLAALSTIKMQKRVEVVPPRSSFIEYPLELSGWSGRSYNFENNENSVLKLKDYLLASYHQGNKVVDLYIGYTDSQRNGAVPHSPKACIPGGGWEITDTRLVNVTVQNRSFQVTRLLINKNGAKNVVYYWFHQRGRDLSNEFPMKLALLYDAIEKNRTDGAIIRLTSSVQESEEKTDQSIQEFIKIMYPTLGKFVPS